MGNITFHNPSSSQCLHIHRATFSLTAISHTYGLNDCIILWETYKITHVWFVIFSGKNISLVSDIFSCFLSFFRAAYTLYLFSYKQHGSYYSGIYCCSLGYSRISLDMSEQFYCLNFKIPCLMCLSSWSLSSSSLSSWTVAWYWDCHAILWLFCLIYLSLWPAVKQLHYDHILLGCDKV
jgi:hypothetical protein